MKLKVYRKKIEDRNPSAITEVKRDLAFQIARQFETKRIIKGYTQEGLATAIGTKQSGIARLERGLTLPSLRFLKKIADEFDCYIELKLNDLSVDYRTHHSRVFCSFLSTNNYHYPQANISDKFIRDTSGVYSSFA